MIATVTILLLAKVCSQYSLDCDNNEERIPAKKWCDGVADCSDSSDEKDDCCSPGFFKKYGECDDVDECNSPGQLGPCSQHCTNTIGSFICTCDYGYTLAENDYDSRLTVCKAIGDNPMFLVSVENAILRTTRDFTDFQELPMSSSQHSDIIYDIDYDHQNGLVFWCSEDREYYGPLHQTHQSIWKASLNNWQLSKPEKIISMIDCASLTVDWVNEKIYWVTHDSGKLIVASYDGYYKITLLWRNLDMLRSVAVSPLSGHIFWSDAGTDPHIGRGNMDGSQQMFLLKESKGDKIKQPSAMTIDHSAGRVYWIDAFYATLHAMDFNGENYPLLQSSPYLASAWNMDIFEDRVYWVDSTVSNTGVLLRSVQSITGKQYNQTSLRNLKSPIRGLRLYHQLLQPSSSNACYKHRCQHFCLLTPDGPQCKCSAGYTLIDPHTCILSDNPCTMDSCDAGLCVKCGSGDCILSELRCDGQRDCYDGSDEGEHCTSTIPPDDVTSPDDDDDVMSRDHDVTTRDNCRAEEFSCHDNKQCVRRDYVCDGKRDCNDGSDEHTCSVRHIRPMRPAMCRLEDFACDDSTCLPKEQVCDSVFDCLDQTDETNCQVEPDCGESQFACLMTRNCIDMSLKCNGVQDCKDGSDEEDCSPETPLCGIGRRKCSESENLCIEEHQFCNGVPDCDNDEDEKYCHCQDPGFIPCGAGVDDDCIPEDKFCDKSVDCKNGSDEKEHCCPHGYSRPMGPPNADGVLPECEDINECLLFDGACSQHCDNTQGGYICSCEEGYDLVNNTDKLMGRTHTLSFCKARGESMRIISARHKSTPNIFVPKHAGGQTTTNIEITGDYEAETLYMSDIDFDIKRKKIFWCAKVDKSKPQSYRKSIWSGDLSLNLESVTNSRVILRNINCDSIAVDWVNQLLYITSDTGSIEVTDYDGGILRAIIWSGLNSPRAIELDPEYGLLFYTDWGVYRPHLGRANMDGSDRQELINNTTTLTKEIEWPNAMTIDHPNKHIYWMDAKLLFLECMKYDGSSRYTVTGRNQGSDHKKLIFPWRMRVFEDKVYWLDMKNAKILSANKFTGNSITEELSEDRGESIRIYHPVMQPPYKARCNPTLCDGLCLPVPGSYKCACPIGHALYSDGRTCTYKTDAFAYVVTKNMIMTMALEPLEPVPQLITFQNESYEETTFWSVDYQEPWVYFNEYSALVSQISITRMSLNGHKTEILYKVVVNEKSKGGLSIDWLNSKIYWANLDAVSVGELDGSVHTTLLQKKEFKFSDILVDPCNGYIYLAVSEKGIYRCDMDGASFTKLISHFDDASLPQPKGLTLDRDTNSLFFANKNVLYQARLNDGLPLTAVPKVTRDVNINSVDLWGKDKIIWTESWIGNATGTNDRPSMENFSRVMAMQKLGGNLDSVQLVRENIRAEIFGIKVHPKRDNTCQPSVSDPCMDHPCSHMCLQGGAHKDHVKGYRCVCPTGYALKEGSTTQCADEIVQYLVYNPDNGIQTVSLDTEFLTPIKEPPNMAFKVRTFDIDARNNLVYYCYGTPNQFEVRGLFDETGEGTVSLPIHTLKCSGMVVEWVTNKLYIVDMGNGLDTGLILVVNLEEPYLMKHIVTKIRRPLNIVVHPLKAKIYWILESHNIMSTNMDGTNVIESIVSSSADQVLFNPTTQMFIDFDTDHLYWTENVERSGAGTLGLIKRVDLATKLVEQVLEVKLQTLSGSTMINRDVYYTDRDQLYRMNGTKGTKLLTTGYTSFLRSSQSQPSIMPNPCEVNNGGCSDFCLLDSALKYRCSCPTGVQLQDSLHCDTPHNNSLIVANATRINMISLSNTGPPIDRVLTDQPDNLKAIDVDITTNKVYWSEIDRDSGSLWMLDLESGIPEKIVAEDMVIPNSIAVDWEAQNIFWVDSNYGKGTVEVMSLRSRKRSVLKQYHEPVGRPHQIVLDPNEMLLFVSYPVPVKYVITRMWMNGNNEYGITGDKLPTHRQDLVINSLAIDLIEKRLYWSSSDDIDHITSCNYEGGAKILYNGLPRGFTAQSISILNRNIFIHEMNVQKVRPLTVAEFRDPNHGDSGIIKIAKNYTFHHIKGAIVSMKIGSIRVLEDSPRECAPNMCCDPNTCTEQICIPTPIMTQCRCADDDTVCQENADNEVESVPNYLPGKPDLCTDSSCSGHGTCVQYLLPGTHNNLTYHTNDKYDIRCACDEGFELPRCAKKSNRISAAPWLAILIAFIFIVGVILVLWFHPKLCRDYRADRLRGESSEVDDTEQGELEAKKLEKLGNAGIGRSYLRPTNNREQPV